MKKLMFPFLLFILTTHPEQWENQQNLQCLFAPGIWACEAQAANKDALIQ